MIERRWLCRRRERSGPVRTTGVCALIAALGTAPAARAEPPSPEAAPAPADPWFGPDKAAHFGVAFGLTAAGYGAGIAAFDNRWAAMALGAGVTACLGAAKEGLDAAGLGHPSAKDFLWDVVGIALGLGVSLTFDAALRGPDHP